MQRHRRKKEKLRLRGPKRNQTFGISLFYSWKSKKNKPSKHLSLQITTSPRDQKKRKHFPLFHLRSSLPSSLNSVLFFWCRGQLLQCQKPKSSLSSLFFSSPPPKKISPSFSSKERKISNPPHCCLLSLPLPEANQRQRPLFKQPQNEVVCDPSFFSFPVSRWPAPYIFRFCMAFIVTLRKPLTWWPVGEGILEAVIVAGW